MAAPDNTSFAGDFSPTKVWRSAVRVTLFVVVVVLIALVAPGFGTLRERLSQASVAWLALAVGLEALSGFSYVLMLKPIFLRGQSWWSAQRLGWSELAVSSIVPSSGVAGLALGAWIFNRVGANPVVIARRSVAFYVIKGSANFVAVAVLGLLMFAGLGPELSPWLTLFPAVVSIILIAAVAMMPRLGPGEHPPDGARRLRRLTATSRRTLAHSASEAGTILRRGEPAVYLGALGYWFFDNAVLYATFRAFGEEPAITVILMGYLIGQLGGLIPIPGGVGGVDGGLVGAFVVFGLPAGTTVIAVVTYRLILFWLPLLVGGVAFIAMQREVKEIEAAIAAAAEREATAEAESGAAAKHGAASATTTTEHKGSAP